MKSPGHIRQYYILEPFRWLFCCFFQPAQFQREFATTSLLRRPLIALRLLLPLFLCSYPLALLLRMLIYRLVPQFYDPYLNNPNDPASGLNSVYFLFDATWATVVSCLFGCLFGGMLGPVYGIAFGLLTGIVDGIIINLRSDVLTILTFGLAMGLILGLVLTNTDATRGSLRATTAGIGFGIMAGVLSGLLAGIFGGFWAGATVRLIGIRWNIQHIIDRSGIEGNVAGMLAGVVIGCLIMKFVGTIAHANNYKWRDVIDVATRVGIAVAGAFGAVVGLLTGDYGMRGDHDHGLMISMITGSIYGLAVGVPFLASYIFSYYRLPLYPISALSLLCTYVSSRKHPEYVFHYLRHSSLHWDECVFPPLPYLQRTLQIAAEQNLDETLSELDFILHERPQQRKVAQSMTWEIALRDLSQRESLRDIGGAQQQLTRTVSQEIRRAEPQVARVFHLLEDASRDAAHYYLYRNWQERHDALISLRVNLKKVAYVFATQALNRQLEGIVQQWQAVAQHELENIQVRSHSETVGRLENPYVPGLVLEQHDPLFVGRSEIAQQLSEALRRDHRPAFFLSGERRMGKSSILKQLPNLLGARYLPIFYDLQSTGIVANIAAFLATIAEEVYDTLLARGMLIKKLEYEQLKEDLKNNEAVVYHRFTLWLKGVELVLAQEDRLLLLAFDEFEKLAEAEQKGYLDLSLLFGWLRSMIQYHPHLTLLFSGVKTIGEMGAQWSGYFVNVEILPVSFLQPAEAYQLILHPQPDFPGERIFGEEVAKAIVEVTGCHPFLVQALCSVLITQLNESTRERATLADMPDAIEEVFKKWGDHYFKDLWDRADQGQRACLKAIYALGPSQAAAIQEYCGMDEATTAALLQKLLKRDLLRRAEDRYCIVAPIFEQWIEQNH